jgi:hypothetical protein
MEPLTNQPSRGFSRVEDRGEDFSNLKDTELVSRLAISSDVVERRKAAKVLGDREIAGKLALSSSEIEIIVGIAGDYIKQTRAKDSKDRTEARDQIERLWHLAAPTLLANVGNRETAEDAIKSLILMRDEAIIRSLVKKVGSASTPDEKNMALFALKQMKEQRQSIVPGRSCMDAKESKKLFDELITPVLKLYAPPPEVDSVSKEPTLDSARQTLADLKLIETAVEVWSLDKMKPEYSTPQWQDLVTYLKSARQSDPRVNACAGIDVLGNAFDLGKTGVPPKVNTKSLKRFEAVTGTGAKAQTFWGKYFPEALIQ